MARTDHYNDPDAPPANSVVPSTTAVVTDDQDRIVLIRRRDNDLWALPGGGMDLGESIVGCAVREVKEETGLDVEVTGLIGVYTNPHHAAVHLDVPRRRHPHRQPAPLRCPRQRQSRPRHPSRRCTRVVARPPARVPTSLGLSTTPPHSHPQLS